MRERIRSHLTFANVVSLAALFVALGGTAMAAYVVSSNSQVGPGTISGHHAPSGKHPNLIAGSVGSRDVANNNLTGADIANRSGVDTCKTPLTKKLGPTCAGSDGVARSLANSITYCAGLGLRLPTWSEAVAMAKNYDVPGVSDVSDSFWTDTLTNGSLQQEFGPIVVEEDGDWAVHVAGSRKAVCVTEPSA